MKKTSSVGKHEKGVTLIAANTTVEGNVIFKDQLFINGHVKGNIYCEAGGEATVVLSEEGRVTGEIRVSEVIINGEVDGDIYAAKRVELAPKAMIVGNVYYKLIEMQLGAKVDGQLVHQEEVEDAKVHPFPSDQVAQESGSGDT